MPYLRLVESRRIKTKNGNITSVKVPVLNIGPLARFDDGKPDFLQRLRQSFKDGEPLIESLRPYVDKTAKDKTVDKVVLSFQQHTPDCVGHPRLFSDAIFAAAFKDLGLSSLLATIKTALKIEYDLTNLVRLVVFGRILNPASKAASIRQNEDYQEPLLTGDFNSYNIYDMLDVVYNGRYRIYRAMNKAISQNKGRDTSVLFYDVTNFYFDIDAPDEDEEDEAGNVVKGLRKKGVSKEHRPTPIVQMGLFMDRDGIPLGVQEFPGNTLDHLTMQDAVKDILQEMNLSRFIFVADRGLCNFKNSVFLLKDKQGYLVSKSIKKSPKEEQDWILDPEGYIPRDKEVGSGFKYKSRIMTRKVKDENGEFFVFKEKVLVYWSRSFYERGMAENKSFLEFLKKLKENPANFRITAAQSKTMKKFMKKDVIHKETGEVLESSKLLPLVDWEKVNEWKEFMGYYQIVTSETEMDDEIIMGIYHELSQIEDRFRLMKGSLETRPIFCRTPEHISAHLVLCAIALIIFVLIQQKIKESGLVEKGKEQMWFSGLSGKRLQRALNLWKIDSLPQGYYRFNDIDDEDLKLVLDAFKIKLEPKLYTAGELRDIRVGIRLF